jgi:hypothetical protein
LCFLPFIESLLAWIGPIDSHTTWISFPGAGQLACLLSITPAAWGTAVTENKPNRRWFRFSLRTLFVVVTTVGVASGWVAYQLNWIRQRHAFFNAYEVPIYTDILTLPKPLPWSLRMFGEPAHGFVMVEPEYMQDAARLFPEARIYDAVQFRSGRLAP